MKNSSENNFLNYAAVIAWLVCIIQYAMYKSIEVPTFHMDGAFQTANGLFRIFEGHSPGKDFLPYLGLGPIYALYPVFLVFGADLAASQIAAYFAVAVASWLSFALLHNLLVQGASPWGSLKSGALIHATVVIIILVGGPSIARAGEIFGLNPGNSLRSFRAFLPYAAAFIYILIDKTHSHYLRVALTSVAAGFFLLWSNDFAFVTYGLFFLLAAFDVYRRKKGFVGFVFFYIPVSLLTYYLLLQIITDGSALILLSYNFKDVAPDQWWYFGPYDEATRIFSYRDTYKIVTVGANIPCLIILAMLSWRLIIAKGGSLSERVVVWLGSALFAGGAISGVGGHNTAGYYAAFYVWTSIVLVLYVIVFAKPRLYKIGVLKKYENLVQAICLMIFMVLVIAVHQYGYYNIKNSKKMFYVEEFDGYMPLTWKPYIELGKSLPENAMMVEEYWGVWGALKRNFYTWRVDSVIHALGGARLYASEELKRAEWIVTSNPENRDSALREWQPWSVSQNYWFYRPIFENWEPVAKSPMTIVWRKMPVGRTSAYVGCQIVNVGQAPQIEIISERLGLHEVSFEYRVDSPFRKILMVRNNLNYSISGNGYASINPQASSVSLPVNVTKTGRNLLDLKISGHGDMGLMVSECSARMMNFSNKSIVGFDK